MTGGWRSGPKRKNRQPIAPRSGRSLRRARARLGLFKTQALERESVSLSPPPHRRSRRQYQLTHSPRNRVSHARAFIRALPIANRLRKFKDPTASLTVPPTPSDFLRAHACLASVWVVAIRRRNGGGGRGPVFSDRVYKERPAPRLATCHQRSDG